MQKQVKKVGNSTYEFSVQTLGSKIAKQSILSQRSRGVLGLMSITSDQESINTMSLLDKLATLEANVQKLDKDSNPDYNFSFFDLELTPENEAHVNKVYDEYMKWQGSFRKKTEEPNE